MVYLDPKSDIVFKRLFGDITHKNVLMSFLNSILERTGDAKIVEVIINDPNNIPEIDENKSSIVDVRCTDQAKNQYIVEMQVVTQDYYDIRAQYYGARALSDQLKSGKKYKTLVPVIFVGVLNFSLFENPDYLSHHLILDAKTHKRELDRLEFHFIELKKFKKKIEELNTVADRWIYFLRNAANLQDIPDNLKSPELEEAFHILEKSGWEQKDLDSYERYLDLVRSDMGRVDYGMRQGIAIGEKKGEKKGIAIGEKKGEKNAQIKIAKQLLSLHDIVTISQITGLGIEDIKKLKKG